MATALPTLDDLLPRPEVVERHERLVRAPLDRTEAALRGLTLRDVPGVAVLVAARAVPTLVTRRGRGLRDSAGRPLLDQAVAAGFSVLADAPGQGVVLGLVGRFWRPGGDLVRTTGLPEFLEVSVPGTAKGVVGFTLTAEGAATRVVTETRVQTGDPGARRAFARYWRLIGPFSGLIRVLLLRAMADRAERQPPERA